MSPYAAEPGSPVEPAPLWAAALRRVADGLRRDLDVARAGGASDAVLGASLRAAGPGFERFVARQGGSASLANAVVDRWATHWARSVVALTAGGRFGDGSVARWVLEWVVPAMRLDLRTVTPLVVDDLVTAAAQVSGRGDATAWARGIEAGLAVWPADVPLTDDRVRELGAVSAWWAGHVRLRAAARSVAAALPAPVARAVLRLEPGQEVGELLARNAAVPCAWGALGALGGLGAAVAKRPVGAFQGFGGAWVLPPVVTGGDGHRWSVVSGATHWTVLTDAFGDAVLPDDSGPTTEDPAPPVREAWWDRYGDDITGAVRARGAVLVSRRSSHRLMLVPDPVPDPMAAP